MTQNKSRDEQADFECPRDGYEGYLWKDGYKSGFDAAERQYLGEIEESKRYSDQLESAFCEENMKVLDLESEVKSLKTDLERAFYLLELGHEYMLEGKKMFTPHTTNSLVDEWLAKTLSFLFTIKSKLGRGE